MILKKIYHRAQKLNITKQITRKIMIKEPIEEKKSEVITEGGAKIWEHEYTKNKTVKQEAFYNKVQIFNRDLSLLAIHTHAERRKNEKKEKFKKHRYLDAFTASGLRALRARKELSSTYFESFTGCDISDDAIDNFKSNLPLNNLNEGDVNIVHDDCKKYMASKGGLDCFEVVDLDPYGSAIPFLASAFNSISNHGLMCITCTDMRDKHKCFYQYGATRARIECFEENALRIALASINRVANEQCKAVRPLLSFQKNFYMRVYVEVIRKKSLCQESYEKTGLIFYARDSGDYHIHRYAKKNDEGRHGYSQFPLELPSLQSEICGGKWQINGPVWLDSINNFDFVKQVLKNFEIATGDEAKKPEELKNMIITKTGDIRGTLNAIIEEEELSDCPVTWDLTHVFGSVKCRTPKKFDIFSALHNAGYKWCQSYQNPKGFKTNAPKSFIFDMVKEWKLKMAKDLNEDPFIGQVKGQMGHNILSRETQHKVDFTVVKEIKKKVKNRKALFFPNPEKNWGPKRAAAIVITRQERPSNELDDEDEVVKKLKTN